MQIRRFWVLVASLVCSYSSYSVSEELVFGSTQNAAAAGYTWVMTNVLPQQAGLEVNGVVYRYTTVKKTEDPMVVNIQNLNALGSGYIFRNSDNWSGLPGNTINKAVPINNIPIQFWGDGSIDVEGQGEVINASVVYTYQFDPCFDPQSDPSCPGYKNPAEFNIQIDEVYDPLNDEFIQQEMQRRVSLDDEEEKDRQRRRVASEKKQRDRLEIALSVIDSALLTAEVEAKAADFFALAEIPQTYTVVNIPGGVYNETVRLMDARLPDNPRGARNTWAQQLLHEKMVDLQYVNLETEE
jgi:hypothetical protein